MGNEKLARFPVFFFSIGVLINCLVFTSSVLDYTLVPRFIFLAFFILANYTFILIFIKKVNLSIDILILPFLLFTLFSLISNIWSLNTSLSIIESSKMFLYFFIFIISVSLLNYYGDYFISVLFKIILILFFVCAFQGLIQMLELPAISRKYLYIITGNTGHKNLYASFIFICMVFSFVSFFYLKSIWKIISVVAFIAELILLYLLQTRAVYIGLIVFLISGLFTFLLHKLVKTANYKYLIIFISISLIVINIFFIYALPRLLNIYNEHRPGSYNTEAATDLSTMTERAIVWDKTYDIIKSHPLLGVGANNWQIHLTATSVPDIYRVKDLNVTFQRPHNDLLWILSEYGIVGFNLYMIFIVFLLLLLLFRLLNNFHISFVILFSGIIAYLIISFFDFPKERIEHNILTGILFGLAYYLVKKEPGFTIRKLFEIPKSVSILFIIPFLIIVYLSLLNFKGEYFTKKMYVERNHRNNNGVIKYCNKALSFCYKIDPTTVPLSWYKGNANANLENYSAAIEDFKDAFRVHPFNPNVINDLGSAYFMNNNIDSAKICYIKSACINPRFDDPKLNLTAIYINEGNYKEAEKWNESIFHDSERRSYYRGIIYEKTNLNN
jgi:O-antigen ligase